MKKLQEDWVVVILGFLVIGLALINIKSPVPMYSWATGEDLAAKVFSSINLINIFIQFAFVFVIALIGAVLTGKPVKYFLYVFPAVYIISVVAMILTGNSQVKTLNLEAVIFSLSLGLLRGNVFRLPTWFRETLSTELFVKIGLVILGTVVIFGDIIKAGSFGLIQAVVVVLSVWYFAYWICGRLKIDKEMTMMISSAVS